MANVLIVQPASLGDICLSLRLVYSVATSYPQHQFTYLLKPSITGIAVTPPSNLEPMTIDLKKKDGTLRGLLALGRKLLYERFDYVFDLYNSRHTNFLGNYLRLFGGTKYYSVPKRYSVRSSFFEDHIPYTKGEEYLRVYKELFIKGGLGPNKPLSEIGINLKSIISFPSKAVGFSPQTKRDEFLSWEDLYRSANYIIDLFSKPVLIFGCNRKDATIPPEELRAKHKNVYFVSNLSFSQELSVLASLELFIGVDCSSIRMAELMNIPIFYLEDFSSMEDKIFSAKEQLIEIITQQ